MRQLCIPVPYIPEGQVADIIFRLEGKEVTYSYKLESLPWEAKNGEEEGNEGNPSQTLERIITLREYIAALSVEWELIQIFTPALGAKHIQVLFRKRND
ncbi:MAG TPA: hypothetical protein VMV56_08350 [Williamwhitmania sp.]|nr:hypothetical protein [Williamwhitmania sp.]